MVTRAPPPWENYFEAGGTNAADRMGDFLGALPQDTYSNTWVGTGYVMDGPAVPPGFTDPNVVPTAFWFGRDQDNPNVLPFSSDAGDTLATATVTGLGPGTSSGTFTDSIWNALYGTKDVDLFSFQASKGMGLTATTSLPASGDSMDTMLRLFDASGNELAFNDDSGGTLYSQLTYSFASAGTYYVGVTGYNNRSYNPFFAGSGSTTNTFGDYQLALNLVERDLSISDVRQNEGDSGTTNANFIVTLSSPSDQTVTVHYATANGTAIAGSDYTATSGTLTIPAGSTTGTISVPVVGDRTDEPGETFFVNLSNATYATITDSQGGGTILNDDPHPGIAIGNVSITEGNSGTKNAAFTVTLSAASGRTTKVNYATADNTATAGSDYTATSGTLTIPAGSTTGTINVTIKGDTTVEPDETFFVNLTTPINVVITDSQGLGKIRNDDTTISIGNVSVTEGNSGTTNANFTVTLSAAASVPVTVHYATADGTATAGSDYLAASGTLTIPAGSTTGTISVPVAGDKLNEANETFTVTLSSSTNAVIATATGTGTILDDDPVPSLSINNVSIAEGNSALRPP